VSQYAIKIDQSIISATIDRHGRDLALHRREWRSIQAQVHERLQAGHGAPRLDLGALRRLTPPPPELGRRRRRGADRHRGRLVDAEAGRDRRPARPPERLRVAQFGEHDGDIVPGLKAH
jgi:hypothetical protein